MPYDTVPAASDLQQARLDSKLLRRCALFRNPDHAAWLGSYLKGDLLPMPASLAKVLNSDPPVGVFTRNTRSLAFKPGELVTRAERQRLYGGGLQRGIEASAITPHIFYSSSRESEQFGYGFDGW